MRKNLPKFSFLHIVYIYYIYICICIIPQHVLLTSFSSLYCLLLALHVTYALPLCCTILLTAYFAIGEGSGCPASHFQNHHIVINLAFCGTVAGNRFANDCPVLYEKYNALLGYTNNSIAACNAYIDSDEAQSILNDTASWNINGVYLYQRE